MARRLDTTAWLEVSTGEHISIHGTCSIGRSSGNDLVLKDSKISRKHALIHTQDSNGYWLVDFGSSNGTWINGRRVVQPTRLSDGDMIELAGVSLLFRQERAKPLTVKGRMTAGSTDYNTREAVCWLLFADIVSSTQLAKKLAEDQIPVVIGKWLFDCKQIIEANGGQINKYLGDGFFAYWLDEPDVPKEVESALKQLRELQASAGLNFRLALHHGAVSIGGAPLRVEELMGRSVNFLFRMEKLAARLERSCLLSAPAKKRLPGGSDATAVGDHSLAGFDGDFSFYSL